MRLKHLKIWIMVFGSLFGSNCNSQHQDSGQSFVDRQPAYAGQFYPGTEKALTSKLVEVFSKAEPSKTDNVIAIIAPHAGFDYSGIVAASAFNQIDPGKEYEHIFVMAPSHRMSFKGASIYCKGNYITPLGSVPVDIDFGRSLINKYDIFFENDASQNNEHSLEVELPFLQYVMKKSYKIIPVVVATQDPEICKKIAESLKQYFNSDNLFIISSDFSSENTISNEEAVHYAM
ncbi:AmmeMemoRadiSam system protein B, partial [candidate division KSB1 bacterium]